MNVSPDFDPEHGEAIVFLVMIIQSSYEISISLGRNRNLVAPAPHQGKRQEIFSSRASLATVASSQIVNSAPNSNPSSRSGFVAGHVDFQTATTASTSSSEGRQDCPSLCLPLYCPFPRQNSLQDRDEIVHSTLLIA